MVFMGLGEDLGGEAGEVGGGNEDLVVLEYLLE